VTLTLLYKTTDAAGIVNQAFLTDQDGRKFSWKKDRGTFFEVIPKKLPRKLKPWHQQKGVPDSYQQRAGWRQTEEVESFLAKLGLIESKVERHKRIAREAIGF